MGNGAAVVAAVRRGGQRPERSLNGGLSPDFTCSSYRRSGSCGSPAKHALPGMVETRTGRLDVGLPPLGICALMVIYDCIEAGQAGTGRQEDCQQEGRLGLN